MPYRLAIAHQSDLKGWVVGLEPTIFGTTIRRVNQLHYTHHILLSPSTSSLRQGSGTDPFIKYDRFERVNEPGGIRTLDLRLRRPLLYPAELQTLKDKLLRTITFPNVC